MKKIYQAFSRWWYWNNYIIIIPLSIIAIIAFIIGTTGFAAKYNCDGYSIATGRPTKFVHMTCYGEINGNWYAQDEYNKIIVPSRIQLEETR